MDRKIGEIFEYNNNKYITKFGYGCMNCAFHHMLCATFKEIRGNCSIYDRLDKKPIIFVEYKEEKSMKNLLNCKGKRFKCVIDGNLTEGHIQVEENRVYLCQNIKNGGICEDKLGYEYSWYVRTGDEYDLLSNYVTNFKLIDMTKEEIENYKDWQVGDKIIHKDGSKGEIIFRSGELVVFKYEYGSASPNRTVEELYENGWRLDEKPYKESIVEITFEEIAKLKGIPVENLRIKDLKIK